MSEYQCYQWKCVGRSLSPKERGEISGLSSHIAVRADSAEVTYHWRDFKHDPVSVLERYFDLFLYEANWGTQRVAFRFGTDTVEVEDLRAFAAGEVITVAEKGGGVLVEAWFDENWVEPVYDYYDQYEHGSIYGRLRLVSGTGYDGGRCLAGPSAVAYVEGRSSLQGRAEDLRQGDIPTSAGRISASGRTNSENTTERPRRGGPQTL